MERVAIYCRLSVEDKNIGKSESIQNQRELLLDYAKRENWSVFDIYEDDDFSGLSENRPAFLRMLEDAKNGKFHIVLCKTQSRFSRNARTAEYYLHEKFPLWQVRFVSVVDGVDTAKKENKKARQIGSLVNEWYSEELSENIRAVLRKKMEMGDFIGNFAPYGYQKKPENPHQLQVRMEEAEVVVSIFQRYLDGLSFVQIANELTAKHIPTPSQTKHQRGEDLGRKATICWSSSTVGKILKNPMYLGHMVQGREVKMSFKDKKTKTLPKENWVIVTDTHEPVVSEKTFRAVQEKMQRKTRRKN